MAFRNAAHGPVAPDRRRKKARAAVVELWLFFKTFCVLAGLVSCLVYSMRLVVGAPYGSLAALAGNKIRAPQGACVARGAAVCICKADVFLFKK